MPVDLVRTPAKANRQTTPSVKRWLIFLLVLISVGGLLTAWLWPVNVSSHTPTFWICSVAIPCLFWTILFIVRWLIFLAPAFSADGWDDTRRQDIEMDIWRGQCSLLIQTQIVHLPHAIATASLPGQLLMTDGISLPLQVDTATNKIIHQARFNNAYLPLEQRLTMQLQALLQDGQLQAAFHQMPSGSALSVLLQTGAGAAFPEWGNLLQELTKQAIGCSLRLTFLESGGVEMVDTWLDLREKDRTLLVIALNMSEKEADGSGDAAVALLLHDEAQQGSEGIAWLHRPEQTKEKGMNYALQQALLWGKSTPEEISQIWLSGMGTSNQAEGVFSQVGVRFPSAGQPCDIDIHLGQTADASPWLAIAVAAENARDTRHSQLLMSSSGENVAPWFAVVRPLTS